MVPVLERPSQGTADTGPEAFSDAAQGGTVVECSVHRPEFGGSLSSEARQSQTCATVDERQGQTSANLSELLRRQNFLSAGDTRYPSTEIAIAARKQLARDLYEGKLSLQEGIDILTWDNKDLL